MAAELVDLLVLEQVMLTKLVEQTKAAVAALEEEIVLHLLVELEETEDPA